MGRTSGRPAGGVPELAITSGTATRPVARGGDTPRGGSEKSWGNRTKQTANRQKLAKKDQKLLTIKTDNFFFFFPGPHSATRPTREITRWNVLELPG